MAQHFTHTLQIQYKNAFGTLIDPTLQSTLQQCNTIIGERQRDFSTTFEVTVTDTATGEILLQVTYLKGNGAMNVDDFLYLPDETPPTQEVVL